MGKYGTMQLEKKGENLQREGWMEAQIIGARIKTLREARGWTQGQLAYKCDTTPAQISRMENNERPGARAVTLALVAQALGTTVDYLVGLTGNPEIEAGADYVPPELAEAVLEIQEIWRRVYKADPEAARELTQIAIIQGKAFETAVNAALRRLESEELEPD